MSELYGIELEGFDVNNEEKDEDLEDDNDEDDDEDEDEDEEETDLDEVIEEAMEIVRMHKQARDQKTKKECGAELTKLIIDNLEFFNSDEEWNKLIKSKTSQQQKVDAIRNKFFSMYEKWNYEEESDEDELDNSNLDALRKYLLDQQFARKETEVQFELVEIKKLFLNIESTSDQKKAVSDLKTLIEKNWDFFQSKYKVQGNPTREDYIKTVALHILQKMQEE